jgi:prepilin-type N-terminal cleavage/methylation domain-containing protein/prepilin-type processing-associated H-X9-DG protein
MNLESAAGSIGFMALKRKTTGKRSAGNPHAAFDEAGAGNGLCNVPRQPSTLFVDEASRETRNSLHRSEFTLVELLVVIAIIALLASMLLPALQLAKDTAKRISCLSNIKSVHTASFMYVSDNKDYLYEGFRDYSMYVQSWDPWPGNDIGMGRLISNKYLSSPDVLYCPDMERAPGSSLNWYFKYYFDENFNKSSNRILGNYSFNLVKLAFAKGSGCFVGNEFDNMSTNQYLISQKADPREAIFADAWINESCVGGYNFFNHNIKGVNVVYLDGHGKWMAKVPSQYLINGNVTKGTSMYLFWNWMKTND